MGEHLAESERAGDLVSPDADELFAVPVSVVPEPPAAPLALYRRYRPDTFADMIGQDHVTEPLQRALANNRVNHAYLFSGPRGCGKTTSARILARALNCERGPAAEPCGECMSCSDLARGGPGSIDVIEIDAASHGGVDDARDLRERAFFAPVHSRYKIYIVDEAHMVTPAGFNALLKLVEEPPPHVKFVFATTEPDKVIGTIRSRTHHYPFRLVPPKVLGAYLASVCQAEGVQVEPAVLPLVVRAGGGSVRDSLSVLDQLLGGAADAGVSYAQATALLGFTPDSLLDEIVDAFAAGDAGGVFACVDKIIEVGQDPRRFAEDLLRRLRDLVIVAAVPDALSSGLVDVAADQADRLQTQAASLGAGELTRAAEVLAHGLAEMRGTTAPRLHLELMCARVLLPGADVDERGVHARLDRLERRIGMTGPQDVVGSPVSDETTDVRPEPARRSSPSPSAVVTGQARAETAPVGGVRRPSDPAAGSHGEAGPGPAAASRPPVPGPTAVGPSAAQPGSAQTSAEPVLQPAGAGVMSTAEVRRLWPEVLEEVKAHRRFTWMLLSQNSQVLEVRDRRLVLGMANVGARDSFAKGGSEAVLAEALVQTLGVDLRIEAVVDPSATGTGPAGAPAARGQTESRHTRSDPHTPAGGDASWPGLGAAPPIGLMGGTSVGPGRAEAGSTDEEATEQDRPPDGSATAPPSPPPVEPTSAAPPAGIRDSIRPMRSRPTGQPGRADDSGGARPDDSDVDDSVASHTDLLAERLGAELIDETDDDA